MKIGDLLCKWHPGMTLSECQELHSSPVDRVRKGGPVGLQTRYDTRLKALYRLNRKLIAQIDGLRDGKERQQLIDERAAVGIAIGLYRDHPDLVLAKLEAREDSLAAERVRQEKRKTRLDRVKNT